MIALLALTGCSAPAAPPAATGEPRCFDLLDAFDRATAFAVDYEEHPTPSQIEKLEGVVAELDEKAAGATGELDAALTHYAVIVERIRDAATDDSIPPVTDDEYDDAVSGMLEACGAEGD
ncbi:ABC type transport system periplasmic glycine betaine/choline-binding (Lipo)protein osmoprotectant binding protein [Microbacterium sp. HM58-2]|nr:ABC type transport system periplasmic glycine betaine/choline-binding (Lipo)protein osmoprotectant binding protein [Microbacterium sp. HM58-2]